MEENIKSIERTFNKIRSDLDYLQSSLEVQLGERFDSIDPTSLNPSKLARRVETLRSEMTCFEEEFMEVEQKKKEYSLKVSQILSESMALLEDMHGLTSADEQHQTKLWESQPEWFSEIDKLRDQIHGVDGLQDAVSVDDASADKSVVKEEESVTHAAEKGRSGRKGTRTTKTGPTSRRVPARRARS